MKPKLYVVHGSHPCAAVERAAELKGIAIQRVELPPPAHFALTRLLGFRSHTVPALRLGDERITGSEPILRRFEALAPEPPLFPSDPAQRARAEEAERFDEEAVQPAARRILWTAFHRCPKALPSFQEHARIRIPAAVVLAAAPLVTRLERRMNDAGDAATRADLLALPAHLDRIDAWLGDGTLGADPPTAADLKLAASVRLLSTIADLAPLLGDRPAARLARRHFPLWDGRVPAGALPRDWLPPEGAGSVSAAATGSA